MLHLEQTVRPPLVPAPALASLREQFEARHWIALPAFLRGPLLEQVQRRLREAAFAVRLHDGVVPPSSDLVPASPTTGAMLELLCNDAALMSGLADATGSGPFTLFRGGIYRLTPECGLEHHWHDDCFEDRRVAMSVNLGGDPFEGGALLIRDRASGAVLQRVTNPRPGDAIVFRIAPSLQHRVEPVTRGAKTAFAGWFHGSGDLLGRLRGALHA